MPVCESSAHNPGYKHTLRTCVLVNKLKARLTNSLPLDMQFLSFFLDV